MNTFIAHATPRRLAIAIAAALVLMAIHGAAPATAGGGIGGSGNASGGGIENRGTSPLYASQMEKISGMAQATSPTLGFETSRAC